MPYKLKTFVETVELDNILAFIIDEISTMQPSCLGALSQRFQQATGNFDAPFGGIPVLLIGDFSQLPPIPPISLVKALLEMEK